MNICAQFLDARLTDGAGSRPAVHGDDGTWSFADLVVASSRWAWLLAAELPPSDGGGPPGRRVLVALPDGPDLAAVFFGALRAGCVPVLASPATPATEVARLLADLGASALVLSTVRAAAAARESGPPGVVCLALESASLQARLADAPRMLDPLPARDGDDAVWQLSSGTTGRPKVVRHTHGGIAASAAAYGAGVLALCPGDVTIAAPKLVFGYAAGANLLFPLAAGGSVVLFPARSTAEALAERIRRHHATVLVTTPAMVRQMVAHAALTREDLSSLRLATSAGEALPQRLHERWAERFGVELLDGLGMTETCHIFISNRPGAVTPGTLGTVLAGYDVRLRGHDGRNVADGEDGELWVRGASLARGYWQRPEEDARVFQDGWCVGGDLLRRNPDGTYSYRGRVDDRLKVNGQWVVPAVVEACLLEHPQVREAAVVGLPDADGLMRPHAFVVADGGGPALAMQLQAQVRAQLDPHAYPRTVVFLAALPRTVQGKLDRAALSAGPRP